MQKSLPFRPRLLLLSAASALLSACASVNLPLCPRVAALSSASDSPPVLTPNRFILEAAKRKDIEVTVITPFVAQYKGSWTSLTWIESNYPALVCAFDPRAVIDPTSLHTSCTRHAPEWIAIVKAGTLDDLFLDPFLFKAICYPRIGGT
jgi:hypothetical protein